MTRRGYLEPEPRVLDIAKFLEVDDATLAILFGQFIAKNICEKPAPKDPDEKDTPPLCSLHGEMHWAVDEWNRPDPIHQFGDFVDAIGATARHFAPARIEISTYVELQSGAWRVTLRACEPHGVATTAYVEGVQAAADERGLAMQRATIIGLLTLADAPATPRTIADLPTVLEQEIRELRTIAAGAPDNPL